MPRRISSPSFERDAHDRRPYSTCRVPAREAGERWIPDPGPSGRAGRRRRAPGGVWLRGEPGESDLAELVERAGQPAGEVAAADAPEELITRLLRAAGASVTGVDIEVPLTDAGELTPQAAVALIELSGFAGTRQVTAALGLGLAMAAAAGAPVRLAEEVLDRVAVPVPGKDLLGPFPHRVPPVAQVLPGRRLAGSPVATLPAKRPRFDPRNLDFADGLDRWDLDSGSRREAHPEDYLAAADGESAVLSAAVPRPAGSAALVQSIFADDYRGAAVVFRGEIRTQPAAVPDRLSRPARALKATTWA